MDPFLGEIRMFGGNFAPRGWAMCNGQQLSVAQNTALFSILGVTYGGNGQTTFGLPDLRSRVPMHFGQGPGLSSYTLGENAGSESVTLLTSEMPMHTHALGCASNAALTSSPDPAGKFMANTDPTNSYADTTDSMSGPLTTAGGSQPHENRQPFLCINFIIALEGVFPSRN